MVLVVAAVLLGGAACAHARPVRTAPSPRAGAAIASQFNPCAPGVAAPWTLAVGVARRGVVERLLGATVSGAWRITRRAGGSTTATTVAVGAKEPRAPARPPTVLATGDSLMEGVDNFLAEDLGARATVADDVHPGFAISAE